jgi:TRAP-type C4-dicarboxylate transport system substrate-binding protein
VTTADAPRSVALVQIFAKEIGDEFVFQPYFNGTLFKQGTELVAVQRSNLDMALLPPSDFAAQVPAFDILGAAYVVRDAAHLDRVFKSEVGQSFVKLARSSASSSSRPPITGRGSSI